MNILKIKSMPEVYVHFRQRICEFLYSIFEVVLDSLESYDAVTVSEKAISSHGEIARKMKKIAKLYALLQ
jgi:hypothetical protein